MRIGVDGACWANRRGYGRYAREIVGAMVRAAPQAEFVCFVDPEAERAFRPVGENVRLVTVSQSRPPTAAAAADGARSLADMLRFSLAVWREPLDVFFSPSVYTYFPLPPGLPAVITIHDAIAERFPELTLPSRRARLFWRAKVAVALRQARVVLTVSDFAGREIARVHGIEPGRIRVAVEAPAEIYRPEKDATLVAGAARRAGVPRGSDWFVYVGGFNPHKNVDLLVRAHARLTREVAEHAPHLVLVGMTEGDSFHGSLDTIRAAVEEEGTSTLVHWPGYLPDEELRALLSGALALALPSECEGFGLPAVEAAACGCPVVATRESPLPELLEGGGVFVAPGDVEALTAGLRLLAFDACARRTYGAGALKAARELSWSAAAADALSALREAAA